MHFSVFLVLLILYLPVLASAEYFFYECYHNAGNYTTNSTYQSNLNLLLSDLKSNSTSTGFAAGSVGIVPDMVTGITNCRGDLNGSACSSCFSKSAADILNLCPYNKMVLYWSNSCFMYVSNRYFLSSLANKPQVALYNIYNVTDDPMRFYEAIGQLMLEMKSWAINNSTKLFATGIATNFSTEYPIIYGLLQCTPDLSKSQCQDCLQQLITGFPNGGDYVPVGARIVGIHCNIRYEHDTFYDGPAMVQIDGTRTTSSNASSHDGTHTTSSNASSHEPTSKKKNNVIALAIIISVAAAAFLSVIFCFCLCKKKYLGGKELLSDKVNSQQNIETADSLLIEFSTLKAATNNFHESNKLGEGGFGAVYKGILPNGEVVAVKWLSQSSGQGLEELKNELVLVAKLQQKNLIRVVGVCLENQEKLLVYEFVPNRSLDTFLFDNGKRQELDWRKRQRIINGVARGLQYLHEDSQLTIIHRDLKASNILLDSDMNPKISDFGLARLFQVEQTAYVTNQIIGTLGYMAPEYAMHGIYSIKSDVYSFGVLVLEILTGRGNSGSFDGERGEDLLSLIWEQWIAGTIIDIMDPVIDCPLNEIIRHVQIGLLCVQETPELRPRMSEAVVMLSTETVSLEAPSKPACYLRRGDISYSEGTSVDMPLQMSKNEISTTQLEAR